LAAKNFDKIEFIAIAKDKRIVKDIGQARFIKNNKGVMKYG